MDWIRRQRVVVLAAAYGLATTVVLSGQLSRSFDFDESVSVMTTIRRGSALVPLTENTVFNNHRVFAVVQSVWWSVGGDGEARQRLFPILYGALAVAILVGWCARRFGLWPAAIAGFVLMANPMFVGEARDLRGYSLATLAVVIAGVSLLEYVRDEDDERGSGSARLLVLHAFFIVAGLGTHLFAGVALGALGIGSLLVLRRLDLRLLTSWVVAGVLTVAVYLPTIDDLRETADARGTRYLPWFGRVTSWEVLGRDRLTATVVGVVAMVGLLALLRRSVTDRGIGTAALVVAGLVIAQGALFWQVLQPFDLYPRFFVASVPLIALAVAIGVRRLPVLGVAVVVAMLFTLGNVADERSSTSGIRDAAAVLTAAEQQGLQRCAVGGMPLKLYGGFADEIGADEPDRFVTCDVLVIVGSWGAPLVAPARDWFTYETRVGGFRVFSVVPIEA
ncbi:MAG: hypothetical protein AAF548_04730 [Actinomycetota bacterium]